MTAVVCYSQVLRTNLKALLLSRRYASVMSSSKIRKQFLDYFIKDKNHHFVRSSPVVPFCDPSVAFVNAGMNQFKGVFLGQQEIHFDRVSNSQKCIRVGGKHNDLQTVGTDGYHHTFFEMLGNWSFGNYYKKDACEMALGLLVGPYGIEKSRLYVTYFEGNELLGLEPDYECREIWKSLGIPEDRILPFGVADNFWEMGLSGPCGPCTEIHIDHLPNGTYKADLVNAGTNEVTELWNIVFIQYNRQPNGTISVLPKMHIDTGMGLERLTAVLQNKTSNYDTDLFMPIFKTIQDNAGGNIPSYGGSFGSELDRAYRILADHARMVTVCLADGMFPDQNYKLRRVLRKALLIGEKYFHRSHGFLSELAVTVSYTLGETYPEVQNNLVKVQHIISHEEEVLKALRLGASDEWKRFVNEKPALQHLDIVELPGLIAGYKEIKKNRNREDKYLNDDVAYKLYDTYGLDEEVIKQIIEIEGLQFNEKKFKEHLKQNRLKSKELFNTINKSDMNALVNLLSNAKEQKTLDHFKYVYSHDYGKYVFPNLTASVQFIFVDGKNVPSIRQSTECMVIFDQTCFYADAGGQVSDTGLILINDNVLFEVSKVTTLAGYVVHCGKVASKDDNQAEFNLNIGDSAVMAIDPKKRVANMCNHTATHLLNAALAKSRPNVATCQKSSKVTPGSLNLQLSIYGSKIGTEEILETENAIRNIIQEKLEVKTYEVNSQDLLKLNDIKLVPGEVYPDDGIKIVEIISKDGFISREACCGTHVHNTGHLEDFCITGVKNVGRGVTDFYAITGEEATHAHSIGTQLVSKLKTLNTELTGSEHSSEKMIKRLSNFKSVLQNSEHDISHLIKIECLNIIDDLQRQVKNENKGCLKKIVDLEMQNVIESTPKNEQGFIVHFLACSSLMDSVHLQKATKLCPDRPIIVVSYTNGIVKARCCVPENFVTDEFNASTWINKITQVFDGQQVPPKGQDPRFVCNLKEKRVKSTCWHDQLSNALKAATAYASQHVK